jgi:hypothetical protein
MDGETVVRTTKGLIDAGYHYVEVGQPEPALSALLQGNDVIVSDSAMDGNMFKMDPGAVLELEAAANHATDLAPEKQALGKLLADISKRGVCLASFGAAGACPLSQPMAQVLLNHGGAICLLKDATWKANKGNYYSTVTFLTTDATHAVKKSEQKGSELRPESSSFYTEMGHQSLYTQSNCPGVHLNAAQLQAMSPALLQYLDLQAQVQGISIG